MNHAAIGHNIDDLGLEIEVRLFNSLARPTPGQGNRRNLTVRAGTTVGEIAGRLGIRRDALHLVLVNGRDVTPGLVGDPVYRGYQVEDGDVVAFSGPVPYSYGYGAPVV